MFRFINAWLQAVFRYITAWLQAAAVVDDSDAVALPQAAMDFPVTASLGPLHRPLHSFMATKNNLPDGVSEGDVRRLEEDLEILFTELKVASEADDPSFTARCWMKEVRELRYDAEDFFGEVPRPCAGAGRSALFAVILWIPSKLKRRRQVAEAFSDLQARARDARRRRQSFQLGPATVKPEFWQANVSRSKRQLCLQLIGLEESMDKLVKLMALEDQEIADLLAFDSQDAEQQVQVVPIFGSAGVGKTTIARAFYGNFGGKFQCRAFVRISRNPDLRRMLSSILSQIKAAPVRGFPDVQDLIDDIREYLQFKRYLIVIDDLWASSTWDIISRAFPDGDCCSRIIVTTEIEDVALACSRYQYKYMYEMSPLNGDQSRKLFLGKAFGSENGCPPDFKEVTYEIIQKCGGLPLAIENIASMLACELNVDQWKHVRDSLPYVLSLRTNPSSKGLKDVLNIIYNNLSPYLKTCLLYLIMYPEGNTISKEDLVKQWVAEDFIGEGQDREKTARNYFDELVSRGLIQPVERNYNDEVLTCTVHRMVLDLIRFKSLEENFIINVSCFQTTPGLPDKVRRLSVQFGAAKCANIPADFMMTQVRSLMFSGFLNCVPSVVEYKFLQVLILHIWADQSKMFDLTRMNELFQLRYLKIDCNITVHLPDEIRQLKLLETLELHAPVNDMPSDISCLPLLRTLGYFDLSKNSIENVQSLGELNNLQDLHLTWSNTAEPDNLKDNIQFLGLILWKLSNLKSLTLVPAASSHTDVLDGAGGASVGISGDVLSSISFPPTLLQRLELSRRCYIFSRLPEWTKELGKLCILKIAVRKLLRKDIDILKGLPSLSALSLYVWTTPVGKVVFDNEGFSVLKYFKFICAAPCVAFLEGAMTSVRELKLAFNANKMEQYSQIVAGLEYLIELKEITAKVGGTGVDDSDKRYAEAALSCAMANHPCTPIIRVQCVDRKFYGEDTSAIQEQEHWTVQEELLDKNLASVLANRDLSHIRSLTLTPSSYIKLPSLAWFGTLGVLDLEGCDRLENYHTKGVGMLFQLMYLSLRGTWISHLPSEVLMLHNLEFLDITDTNIEVLPAGIANLPKLRYLRVEIPNGIRSMKNSSGTSSGSLDAHEELGNLINLNELDLEVGYGINTGSLGAILKLGNLTNLNLKYGKIGSEYNWHEECPSRVELSLRKLGMCWRSSWSPLPFSNQRFEMSSCYNLRCIPERISPALNHLKYLEITKVEVTEKDLRILGEMPVLLYLGLTCQTIRKERLIFYSTGFPRLKEFVYDAAVLPSGNLLFEEGALPLLKDLGLVYCVSVVDAYGFHLGIEHLSRLKNAQVRLYKEGATSSDITSAEVAIMNEADAHPNRPRVTLVEHVKREGYCSGGCSNATVTELL